MKILIAPQAFKGYASAKIIASAIAEQVKKAFPEAKIVQMPVADGGDGTLDILIEATAGQRFPCTVSGPLGEKIASAWGAFQKPIHTAIIESALICGMALLDPKKRNPLVTTSHGVGEAIKQALYHGCRRIFVGLGGSATNDAGVGLAQALGVRFLDSQGCQLPHGGAALQHLHRIDTSQIDLRIANTEIIAGCDVDNPLIGPQGASLIYSPQKGASPSMAKQLEASLKHFAEIAEKTVGKTINDMPFGGAAGGMAAGMHLFLNAKLVSGAQWILDAIGFETHLQNADLVIVAEGCMDGQTARLKAPITVAKMAKKFHIPVLALPGTVGPGYETVLSNGIDAVIPISQATPNAIRTFLKMKDEL